MRNCTIFLPIRRLQQIADYIKKSLFYLQIMISTFFDDVNPKGILMSLAPCQLKINYDIILS